MWSTARRFVQVAVRQYGPVSVQRGATFALPSQALGLRAAKTVAVASCRALSTTQLSREIENELLDLQDMFVEAREELVDTQESVDTVWFDEDYLEAQRLVNETLAAYEALLSKLNDEEKQMVQRANGLKMEQLKGELEMLSRAHDD